jgi:glycerol-3-phosphate dehydrogenase subunit C
MPQLEGGNLAAVAAAAKSVADALRVWIDKGYDIIALVPSCALMLKFEWPLIVPNDAAIEKLATATYDISEYIVGLARREGLAKGLTPLDGGVTLHIACHARAQNIGHKSAEMLRLVPDTEIKIIERCSGHGGSWGVMKGNFETAIKHGTPVARQALRDNELYLEYEYPLAALHVLHHPIELFARAYRIAIDGAVPIARQS